MIPPRFRYEPEAWSRLFLRDYFAVDLTITPKPATGNFTHWEPGELMLVEPGADAMECDGEHCDVCEVWIHEEDGFQRDEGMKYVGEKRIRLLVAGKPGTKHLIAQYYFEQFGDIDLSYAPELVGV